MTRDNYSYKKYQKELAGKKKAEEKKQRKLEKKAVEDKERIALSDSKCDSFQGDSGQAVNSQAE